MKMRRKSIDMALLALLAGGGASLSGCDEVQNALAQLAKQNQTGPRMLSDEDAFKHLARDRSAAPKTDVSSINKVIDGQVEKSSGQKRNFKANDPGVAKLLKSVAHTRRTIQTDKFEQTMDEQVQQYLKNKRAYKAECSADIDMSDPAIKDEWTDRKSVV